MFINLTESKTSTGERNTDQLPPAHSQPGMEPAMFGVWDDAPTHRATWPDFPIYFGNELL